MDKFLLMPYKSLKSFSGSLTSPEAFCSSVCMGKACGSVLLLALSSQSQGEQASWGLTATWRGFCDFFFSVCSYQSLFYRVGGGLMFTGTIQGICHSSGRH